MKYQLLLTFLATALLNSAVLDVCTLFLHPGLFFSESLISSPELLVRSA